MITIYRICQTADHKLTCEVKSPMQSTNNYCSPSHFEKDLLIFRHFWQVVGLREDLKDNNSFITTNIAGCPVLIQNFAGELKAFVNICAHRCAKIHNEEKGKRKLVCGYHGWSYDSDGCLVGAPGLHRFASHVVAKARLTKIDLKVVGNVILVRLRSQSDGELFGVFTQEIESLFGRLAKPIFSERMFFNANWKVVVENVLEAYHVKSAHPTTLGRQGLDLEEVPAFCDADCHSKMTIKRKRDNSDGFIHYLLFPNISIGIFGGKFAYLARVEPKACDKTDFKYSVFDLSPVADHHTDFHEATIALIQKTLAEDRALCEQVQEGLTFTSREPIFGSDEKRIISFQNHYTNILGDLNEYRSSKAESQRSDYYHNEAGN